MSDTIERPKSYEEGLRDGFIKGQEESNKVMEQMLHATCNPVVCDLPETEAIKLLKERIKELEKSNENFANQSMILLNGQVKLESQINDLKLQIQKMKRCENCKFIGEDCYSRKICKLDDGKSQWVMTCHNFDHWQLK